MKPESGNKNIADDSVEELFKACAFFNLPETYGSVKSGEHTGCESQTEPPFIITEELINKRFHELALKYHPDSGDYTTPEMFNRLILYRDILKKHAAQEIHFTNSIDTQNENTILDDFGLYKKAKKIENDAILKYFNATEGNRIYLDAKENPPLQELQESLKNTIVLYTRILEEFPESMWKRDIETSLKKIRNSWLKG